MTSPRGEDVFFGHAIHPRCSTKSRGPRNQACYARLRRRQPPVVSLNGV